MAGDDHDHILTAPLDLEDQVEQGIVDGPVMMTTVVPQARAGVSLLSISVSGRAGEVWRRASRSRMCTSWARPLRDGMGCTGRLPARLSTPLVVRPTACFWATAQFASGSRNDDRQFGRIDAGV